MTYEEGIERMRDSLSYWEEVMEQQLKQSELLRNEKLIAHANGQVEAYRHSLRALGEWNI